MMVKKIKENKKAKGTKIALSSNDDKRIQTFDKITTYPYGASVFKICENEMINVYNAKETLRKINESENELYVACSMFLNYIKRKCTMEMKENVKLPKKKVVKYMKRKCACKITDKTL